MKNVSRRKFIIGASAGAVAIGAGVGVPAVVIGQNQAQKAAKFAATLERPLTLYLRDASKGEMVLLADDKQVIIHDSDLANRLLNAAQ
ncbi:MAG TPA: twin-arginine translocation signal domain-containing protein [Ktedonobacterales bacterium]